MNEIQSYLQSNHPDLEDGIALLERFGKKPFLPKNLRRMLKAYPGRVRSALEYELGKLAEGRGLRAVRVKHPSKKAKPVRPLDQHLPEGSAHTDIPQEKPRTDILNDAGKYQRSQDQVTKEINRRMKALYDEGTHLKWTQLNEENTKEERKKAAFRVIEIYRKLLPPLYQDRDNYIHQNIKPKWMLKPKPDIDRSKLPPVSEMMKAVKNYPTYISKYKDNPKRADDVKKWRNDLETFRKALGMN